MNFTKVHVKIKQKKSAVKNKSAVKKNKHQTKKKHQTKNKPIQRKSIYETIARVVAARKAFKKIPQTWRRV
jgi:hypothetical protein